jgi:hypothetical protein
VLDLFARRLLLQLNKSEFKDLIHIWGSFENFLRNEAMEVEDELTCLAKLELDKFTLDGVL